MSEKLNNNGLGVSIVKNYISIIIKINYYVYKTSTSGMLVHFLELDIILNMLQL